MKESFASARGRKSLNGYVYIYRIVIDDCVDLPGHCSLQHTLQHSAQR